MATNPPIGNNARKGAIRKRSQTYNPKVKLYVKRNNTTGKFMDVKANGKKFKAVRLEH